MRYTANTVGPVMYFVIHPGADPTDIRLVMAGQDSLVQWAGGSLKAVLGQQAIVFPKGTIYQINSSGVPYIVPPGLANWTYFNDSTVGLNVGSYNTSDELVIKVGWPYLPTGTTAEGNKEWFTFYGNQGNEGWAKMKADANGDLYHVTARSGVNFPVQNGVTSQSQNAFGAQDLLATKFNASAQRVWATYFGGTGDETISEVGISTGSNGEVFMVGRTLSTDILTQSVSGGYNQSVNSSTLAGGFEPDDGLIVTLNKSNGNRTWATYFGGGGDDDVAALDINDAEGKLFIAGSSGSATYTPVSACNTPPANGNQFPVCAGNGTRYVNLTPSSAEDAFVAEFSLATKALEWCTYVGAEEFEAPSDIISTGSGTGLAIFVTGSTSSDQTAATAGLPFPTTPLTAPSGGGLFPLVNPGAGAYFDGSNLGSNTEGFLIRFNADRQISWGTFWGGNNLDIPSSLAANSVGDVYMAGVTSSQPTSNTQTTFPLFQGTGSPFYDNVLSGGLYDAFVARFSNSGVRKWSTYLGGSASESDLSNPLGVTNLVKLALDNNDNVYVAGYGEMTGATTSATGSDFPVLSAGGSYNQDKNASYNAPSSHEARYDGWLAMFNSANKDRWITWLGGTTGSPFPGSPYFGTQAYDVVSDLTIGNGKLFLTGTTNDLGLEARVENPGNGAYFDGIFSENALTSSDAFIGRFSLLPLQMEVREVPWGAGSSGLTVHPNPSAGYYEVGYISERSGDARARVLVTNAVGQVVLRDEVPVGNRANKFGINLGRLPAGMYLLQVQDGDVRATATLVKH